MPLLFDAQNSLLLLKGSAQLHCLTTVCLRSSPFSVFRALEQILVFIFCLHGGEVTNPALKVSIEITSTIQNGFKGKFMGSVDF